MINQQIQAAEQGDTGPQYVLVPAGDDDDLPAEFFEPFIGGSGQKKAEQGEAQAQYYLGQCYANGWDVEQNQEQAVHWYRQAAEQGEVNAQYKLGLCYMKGEGVDQEYKQDV